MTLLQRYFWRQSLWPLLITLAALTTLALLTQSLSTLDLIVENRQTALTFFKITLLALPQLIAIILPVATFFAVLYAFNRLNVDSELMVTKASGVSPWQIASPALRLASYAMTAQLIINILAQPFAFREMRHALSDIRNDVAAKMVQAGNFITPIDGLTFYAREVFPNGYMQDILIYDDRNSDEPVTYMAKTGYLYQNEGQTRFILNTASYQIVKDDKSLDILEVERDEIDLTDILAASGPTHLKASDRFLHELLRPDPETLRDTRQAREFLAEGHGRLSMPLYNIALTLLALSFLIRGPYQRTGYHRPITICSIIGFSVYLASFAIQSAAKGNPALNSLQYGLPLALSLICLIALLFRNPRQRGTRTRSLKGPA